MLCSDIIYVGRSLQNSGQRYENPYMYNVLQVGLNALPQNQNNIVPLCLTKVWHIFIMFCEKIVQ